MSFDIGYSKALVPLLVAFGGAAFVLSPLLFLLVLIGALMYLRHSGGKINYYCVAILLAFWMASINLLKIPESDQLNYIAALEQVSQLGMGEVLGFMSLGVSPTEPLFALYLKAISILDKSGFLLIFLSTMIIYLSASVIVRNICALFKVESGLLIYLCLICAAFIFITFSLTGQIIRQYFAFSLFFVGLSFLLLERSKWPWLLMMTSVLVHNSALILCGAAFISHGYMRLSRGKGLFLLVLLTCLGGLAVRRVAFEYGLGGAFGVEETIPGVLILIDAMIFIGFVITSKSLMHNRVRARIMAFSCVVILMLIALYSFPLLFLRYYFVMDFLRMLWAASVLFVIYRPLRPLAPSLFALVVGVAVFSVRADSAPWSYSLGFPDMYFSTAIELVSAQLNIYAGS